MNCIAAPGGFPLATNTARSPALRSPSTGTPQRPQSALSAGRHTAAGDAAARSVAGSGSPYGGGGGGGGFGAGYSYGGGHGLGSPGFGGGSRGQSFTGLSSVDEGGGGGSGGSRHRQQGLLGGGEVALAPGHQLPRTKTLGSPHGWGGGSSAAGGSSVGRQGQGGRVADLEDDDY